MRIRCNQSGRRITCWLRRVSPQLGCIQLCFKDFNFLLQFPNGVIFVRFESIFGQYQVHFMRFASWRQNRLGTLEVFFISHHLSFLFSIFFLLIRQALHVCSVICIIELPWQVPISLLLRQTSFLLRICTLNKLRLIFFLLIIQVALVFASRLESQWRAMTHLWQVIGFFS